MKKVTCMLLLALMLMSISCSASEIEVTSYNGESSQSMIDDLNAPTAVLFDIQIAGSTATYRTEAYTTVSGQGNILRYWYSNKSKSACQVEVYKKGLYRDSMVSSMRVEGNGQKTGVYNNPGSSNYYWIVRSVDGSALKGQLRANQTNSTT